MPVIESAVAIYLCSIMAVLGIISFVGYNRQKSTENKK